MEFWPAQYQHKESSDTEEKKGKHHPTRYEYPYLETGRLGAVSLVEKDGRFEWTHAFQDFSEGLKCNEPITVFPATRRPPTTIPQTSIQHRAEQSANFLRTVLPEVDITSELVRDELASDEKMMRSLEQYDPYAGNLMETLRGSGDSRQYLAFPFGELGCDLNVSPILQTEQGDVFRPASRSTRTFQTPIRQLVSNKVSEESATLLGVRTYGPTFILEMRHDEESGSLRTVELGSFNRARTGDRPSVDVSFLSDSSPVLVNDIGLMDIISQGEDQYTDSTWRLAPSSLPSGMFLSSSKVVQEFDMRDPGQPSCLFRMSDKTTDLLVGIENFTLLTSRKNALVTVYDLSRSDELLKMQCHPYVLPFGQDDTFSGNALLERANGQVKKVTPQQLEWSDDIHSLDSAASSMKPDDGPLGKRDLSMIFSRHWKMNKEEEEEEHADAVYDLIDDLPTFWQRYEAPSDNILTTYDVILSSSDTPMYSSRSDFLSGSIFNSTRGYRALAQNRFPWDSIRKRAAWHHDISQNLAADTSLKLNDIDELSQQLRAFDLNMGDDHPAQAGKRQKKAREQLALDLMLSKDVLCHRPKLSSLDAEPPPVNFSFLRPVRKADYYSRDEDGDNEISPLGVRLLLKEWELGTNPDEMVYKDPYDDQTQEAVIGPWGTRMYKNWVQPSSPEEAYVTPSEAKVPPTVMTSTSVINMRKQLKAAMQAQIPAVGSQPMQGQGGDSQSQSQSQELASTQVLPGPFGGRPKKKPAKKRVGGF
ncbi:hypothetical protein VNI00_003238 [Paramarasmius palmivorus]|uniref:RRN6 K-rich C-terminal domain-containing protein n=1 Tax=Paramarasmius palmivorus TaxID=297713 RepID=A0AAW0DU03_9AGAR